MPSRQRNPSLKGSYSTTDQTHVDKAIGSLINNGKAVRLSSESTAGSRDTTPSENDRLQSASAKKSPELNRPSPKSHLEKVVQNVPAEARPCERTLLLKTESGRDRTEQSWKHVVLEPATTGAPIMPPATETQHNGIRIKGLCMKGTGEWEPVNAKIDFSSKHSILDSKAASELGLTLNPISRQTIPERCLYHSSYNVPKYCASNVGLRSSNVGLRSSNVGLKSVPIHISTTCIDILVAHVKVKGEHLIIGRELYQMLKMEQENTGPRLTALCDFRPNQTLEAKLPNPGREDVNSQVLLESLSTGPETFLLGLDGSTLLPFPSQLASIHENNEPSRLW